MNSVFNKRDAYTGINQADEDVRLLDDEENTDDQPTFDFRSNSDLMEPSPGTSAVTVGDGSMICDIPDENGRVEFLNFHEPVHRQFSVSDYQANVETEENLKCVVSSLLFVGIVVTLLLVAFLINPSI